MENLEIARQFSELSTPLVADACFRRNQPFRLAARGIRPLSQGMKAAGRVIPARHYGSVDIFLEAINAAKPGDVLVIDNGGRSDEGCVGDLIALEAKAAGLAGILIWGFHRDSAEIRALKFPLFSYGACPSGPLRVERREPAALSSARIGDFIVTGEDAVFADDDGAIFVKEQNLVDILSTAREIAAIERQQANRLRGGQSLREQLKFDEYLRKRAEDPAYTLRAHLKQIGGAVEE